jgi:Na+-transporting methylmalonyl-CoA/oxaloacetate decarboxylase gamma subunit
MKRKSFTPVGALHPILFFAGVYVVALFFSIFICSTIFYSCNTSANAPIAKEKKAETKEVSNNTVASLK